MNGSPQNNYKQATAGAQISNVTAANNATNAGATSARSRENDLENGRLYIGVVQTVDYLTKTATVAVGSRQVSGCIYVAGSLASFFGVINQAMPLPGASVLLSYMGSGGTSLIIGTLGDLAPTLKTGTYAITGDHELIATQCEAFKQDSSKLKGGIQKGLPLPLNLLPGELNMTTGLGPAFKLLYNFAQLSASDAAKVEAHVLNDMVRIVDNYFVHHSCGGDELIWGAGGSCTKEEHFTGVLYEAEGKLSENDVLADGEIASMNYDVPESVDNIYSDTGRWRLSTYYGFLGDMIHKWVTTPTEVMSNIMEESFRAGQFRSWVGSDGTYCIQAAGGIQLEVTQFVVIPAILKSWNDPTFDMEKAMDDLDAEFLKVWGKGPDWEDLTVAVWQLNYYSKYLTLWHSLARFRQLQNKGYCTIPTETDAPMRTPVAGEEERIQAIPEANYPVPEDTSHAIFSMDPGGSIALVSQGKTSVVLNNGSIQFACPGNIEIQAGGTVSIQGKNVSVRGAQIVELVSFFGSLTMKARTKLAALCEAGIVWLKGDASKNKEVPEDPFGGKEEPEFREYAVVIDASEGKTLVHGATGVTIGTSQEDSSIDLQTAGGKGVINMIADLGINFIARAGSIYNKCLNWLADATYSGLYGNEIKLGAGAVVKDGKLQANAVCTLSTSALAFVGKSKYVVEGDPEQPELDTAELDSIRQSNMQQVTASIQETFVQTEFKDNPTFKFADWNTDIIAQDVVETTSLKKPFYIYNAELEDSDMYVTFNVQETALLSASRTETSYPFPGTEVQWFVNNSTTEETLLGKGWSRDFSSSDIKSANDMAPQAYSYAFLDQ